LIEGKWKAMPDFLVPFLSSYRKDAWTMAGFANGPDTWDDLVKGGELKAIVTSTGNPDQLGDCHWSTDTRLICRIVITTNINSDRLGFSRIIAVDSGRRETRGSPPGSRHSWMACPTGPA